MIKWIVVAFPFKKQATSNKKIISPVLPGEVVYLAELMREVVLLRSYLYIFKTHGKSLKLEENKREENKRKKGEDA